MEFSFNINNIFGNEITKVDKALQPHRTNGREYRTQLCQIIDRMGDASAKAQSLNGSITSVSRLQMSTHNMYIMKDPEANGGNGAVVGFIKMGHKRLFIYDHHGAQLEMEPICALDFYVHESRQRMGCGRKLFEAMLQEENLKPHQIAIDRPSHKFLSFLQKHYGLKATVKQVNNFVIFDGFFRDKPANAILDRRRHKTPLHPYKKFSGESDLDRLSRLSDRPPSGSRLPMSQLERERAAEPTEYVDLHRKFGSLDLLAWRDSNSQHHSQKDVLSHVPLQRQNSREGSASSARLQSTLGEGDQYSKAMGAQGSMYSRHGNTTPAAQPPTPVVQRTGSVDNDKLDKLDVSKRLIGGKDPPLLARDGPSADYMRFLGRDVYNAEIYQKRGGHLKVAPQDGKSPVTPVHRSGVPPYPKKSTSDQSPFSNQMPDLYQQNGPKALNSAWNVFGVPPNPRSTQNSKFSNRLW